MAAIAAAGFPGTFPSLLPCSTANPSSSTGGTIIGDYSNATDPDSNSGWRISGFFPQLLLLLFLYELSQNLLPVLLEWHRCLSFD